MFNVIAFLLNFVEYKLEDSFIERYLGQLTPLEESTLMQVNIKHVVYIQIGKLLISLPSSSPKLHFLHLKTRIQRLIMPLCHVGTAVIILNVFEKNLPT